MMPTIPVPADRTPGTERDSAGLTRDEVAQRVALGEVNRAPRQAWADYRAIAARNIFTLFNALVAPAAVALFLLKDYPGAWAVSALALINTVLGLAHELRARRHLERLAILSEGKARVMRDGTEQVIPAGEVVRGDHLLLSDGEAVIADGPLLRAEYLEVDEALLTGESQPVPRRAGERLLSGSFCVAGSGAYRADAVGPASHANRTAAEARQYRHAPGPMQRVLDRLIGILTVVAVALCLGYAALSLVRPLPVGDLVRMVAATITSMVPQGLVMMATLTFVLGAVRLGLRGALVQRLAAVEAMASLDVLCLDKTGTLTTGALTLDRLDRLAPEDEEILRDRLRLFAWATVDRNNRSIQALRDSLGPMPGTAPALLDQVPFKAQNRYSAVRVQGNGGEVVLALGAVEALSPCLSPADAARVEERWRPLLATGLRVLLFAQGDSSARGPFAGSLQGQALRPLALVGLADEVRPGAEAVLAELAAGGIRFVVLSGDHPETVRATVARLRLPLLQGPVLTGDELESSPDREARIVRTGVFGRVSPRQKLDVVATLQKHGLLVGMLGDGINDVLPIKQADLGIAMGAGSGATRAVAGVVLESDDFALLPALLEEGRTIVGNLRRAAKLFLLKNVYTLFLIVVALGILGLGFPYLPQQVTLLNKLTIGVPAFLILTSRATARPGGKASATSQEPFLAEVGRFVLGAGLATGMATLAAFLASSWAGDSLATSRTVLLSTLILLSLGNVLLVGEGDWRLAAWAGMALPLYLALMYLGPTAAFFALEPLDGPHWLLASLLAGGGLLGCVLADRWRGGGPRG